MAWANKDKGQQGKPNGAAPPPAAGAKSKAGGAGPSGGVQPGLRFLVREKESLSFFMQGEDGFEKSPPLVTGLCEDVMLHEPKDGNLIAAYQKGEASVVAVSSETGEVVQKIPDQLRVSEIQFSPKGTFLVVLSNMDRQDAEKPNMRVYHTQTGEMVGSFVQQHWPALEWSPDESIAVRYMSKSLYSVPGDAITGEAISKREGKFSSQAMAHVDPPLVALLTRKPSQTTDKGQATGGPGKIKILKAGELHRDLISYDLSKVDDCDFLFNSTGGYLLAHSSLEVDVTGASYYGSSCLTLFSTTKKDEKFTIRLGAGKGERVHDVQWSPLGNEFAAVYGVMPDNKITVFSCKGEPVHHFPIAPRNTIRWSPNGQFIMVAGFGNLVGDMEVWERRKLAKGENQKSVAKMTHKSATSCVWSPDSREIITAICHPRMRVDNCAVVWKHNGVLRAKHEMAMCYEAAWRPLPRQLFTDRDPSPPPRGHKPETVGKKAGEPEAKVYRAAGGTKIADALRNRSSAGGGYATRQVATANFGKIDNTKRDAIPGVSPEMAKKQAAAKAKKGGGKKEEGGAPKEKKPKAEKAKAPTDSKASFFGSEISSPTPVPSVQDDLKILKILRKKIKDMEILQGKKPSEMNEAQKTKLGQLPETRVKVAELEAKLGDQAPPA